MENKEPGDELFDRLSVSTASIILIPAEPAQIFFFPKQY